ncbi:MAG: hypothetical protein Q9186_002891 [Xanthomendoza sp. 1 TL-2023]
MKEGLMEEPPKALRTINFIEPDTVTGQGGRCASGQASKDVDTSPKFSCGSEQKGMSIDHIHVSTSEETDIELHYGYDNGDVCKQTETCSPAGKIIKNHQCGDAKSVTVKLPDTDKKDKCEVGIHSVGFNCGPSSKPPVPSSTPVTSTPVGTAPITSTPPDTTETKPYPYPTANTTLPGPTTAPSSTTPFPSVFTSTSDVSIPSTTLESTITPIYSNTSTTSTSPIETIPSTTPTYSNTSISFTSPVETIPTTTAPGTTVPVVTTEVFYIRGFDCTTDPRDFDHTINPGDFDHTINPRNFDHTTNPRDFDHTTIPRDFDHTNDPRDYSYLEQYGQLSRDPNIVDLCSQQLHTYPNNHSGCRHHRSYSNHSYDLSSHEYNYFRRYHFGADNHHCLDNNPHVHIDHLHPMRFTTASIRNPSVSACADFSEHRKLARCRDVRTYHPTFAASAIITRPIITRPITTRPMPHRPPQLHEDLDNNHHMQGQRRFELLLPRRRGALSYLAGICAPHVSNNPGIITNVPKTITLVPTPASPSQTSPQPSSPAVTSGAPIPPASPAPENPASPPVPENPIATSSVANSPVGGTIPPPAPIPVTTITLSQTVPSACPVSQLADGQPQAPASNTCSSLLVTQVVVPQVGFATGPAAPGVTSSSVGLVAGSPAPVTATATQGPVGGVPTTFGTFVGGASPTGVSGPVVPFIGAANSHKATTGFGILVAALGAVLLV